ncbi:MAG: pyruvate kinase [Chloroflexota bacterium]|nr:pyruvate kinase [Chloroflexota bacterium]
MERRVKIVSTLGPSVSTPERLHQLLEAGVDVVRINAAHGTNESRAELIRYVREAADALGKRVPILFDLQGLKIRTGPLPEGADPLPIARGTSVRLVPRPEPTSPEQIGVTLGTLLDVISPGSRVLISDGLIELHVTEVTSDHAVATVGRGGLLLGRQGVTLPGAPIRGGALTDADKADVAFAMSQQVDYFGLSFINDASDLELARNEALKHGRNVPGLIAKIERPEALDNLRDIACEADGLMVARGDLGVQLPPEQVPRAQKRIIAMANEIGVPVITATQMLESMITQPVATRAETSDVANAVWDGTDAVMLSAETAVGKYPIEAVLTMDRIIREVEKDGPARSQQAGIHAIIRPDDEAQRFADAIARAAYALAVDTPVRFLVVFTKTGSAVRRIAKYRPSPPIIGVADNEETARRLGLVWGVRSIVVPVETDPDAVFRKAGQQIVAEGFAQHSEYALLVGSLPMTQEAGRTNLVHFRQLGT